MDYDSLSPSGAIRRCPDVYRRIVDVFDKHPRAKGSWDIEASFSLPALRHVAPDLIERIREKVSADQFEIFFDTWSFSLASLHTKEEFEYQHRLARKELEHSFGTVAPVFISQEGVYHPALPKLLRQNGVKQLLLCDRLISAYNELEEIDHHRLLEVKGHDGTTLPVISFNSAGCLGFCESAGVKYIRQLVKKHRNDKGDLLVSTSGDAEGYEYGKLHKFFTELEKMENVEFILPSDYLRNHKPARTIYVEDGSWQPDESGLQTHNSWLSDQMDKKLWTLVNRVRVCLEQARYWKKMCQSSRIDISGVEELYHKAMKWLIIAQNSDRYGWLPSIDKRALGKNELQLALEHASLYKCIVAEKYLRAAGRINKTQQIWPKRRKYLFYNYSTKNAYVPVNFRVHLNPNEVPADSRGPGKIDVSNIDSNYSELYPLSAEISTVARVPAGKTKTFSVNLVEGRALNSTDKKWRRKNSLETDHLKLTFTDGDIAAFLDKKNNYRYSDTTPFLATEIKVVPYQDRLFCADQSQAEALLHESHAKYSRTRLLSSTKTSVSTANNFLLAKCENRYAHNIEEKITYSLYYDMPLVQIDKTLHFPEKMMGEITPYLLRPTIKRPRQIFRELGSEIVPRMIPKHDPPRDPIVNDWVVVADDHRGLMIAADGKIHALKEYKDQDQQEGEALKLFHTATLFPGVVESEALLGRYHYRLFLSPFKGKPANKIFHLARSLTYSPGVIDILRIQRPF